MSSDLTLSFILLAILFISSLLPIWPKVDDIYNDYWRKQIAQNSLPSGDIVIIEIDDKSLTDLELRLGRWPWSRSIHATLVEYLVASDAKGIAFDIIFSERDVFRPEDDAHFNESISNYDNTFYAATVLPDSFPVEPIPLGLLPKQFFTDSSGERTMPDAEAKFALPWIIEDTSKWNIGLINFITDWDSVVRQYPAVSNLEGWQTLSLPARIARDLYGVEPLSLGESFNLKYKGNSSVPFQSISFSDALHLFESGKDIGFIKDKVIIIGATATGLHDIKESPIEKFYPGTSILAMALDNLITQESLKPVDRKIAFTISLLVTICLIISVRFIQEYRVKLLLALLVVITVSFCIFGISWFLVDKDYLFPAATSLGPFYLVAILFLFYSGLREFLNKRHALKTFSRFMDPQVVKELIADENWEESFEHKSTQVSVLFSDIRGFTSLSEKRSAVEIMDILNRYFDSQVEVIFEHKGTLDKFIGDAIMAFWGAPITDKQHAKNAINAALSMVDNLIVFRESLPEEIRDFDVGIGIHSGEAVVGMLGSAKRFDYTAIGDTVNLASRIEGKTKGIARVLVSENTKNLCEKDFNFEYKGQFAVKGRQEEVKLFEPSRRDI